ncbi:hypothetical protein AWE51_08810 [Aquimarina aggregata]|uniref:Uncharacterized protein n=2 Tax=Aquimarina aggregata TaxID=1642818 RepID=A0A162ZE22_9FLAO|nr:hypothetical protein AWE51_08810 [Aquimarina aggregata]
MEPCFTYFPIDVGDIWEFESGLFLDGKTNEQLLASSLEKIRTMTIERGRPSVTYDGSQYSEDMIRYYRSKVERFLNATDLQALVSLGYFVSRDDLYQYGQNIIIKKEDSDFDYWYALKLRQYNLGLKHLKEFLNHHLESSFENNKSEFKEFLELVLLQYEDQFLSTKVAQLTRKFIETTTQVVPEKKENQSPKSIKKRTRAPGIFHSFKLTALQSNPRYFTTRKHEFKELFQDLMDYGFMKGKSSFATFEKLFSNQKIAKNKRLVWVGKKVYLRFFILYLIKNDLVDPVGQDNWLITTQCFVDEDGSDFEIIQLRSARGGVQERMERLESILERF